jgi:hypothetical protein
MMGELAKLLGKYVAVVAGAAASLLVLDAAPYFLSGAGRGVTTYQNVEAAERALGTTFLLPAFFPDAFRWPPSKVEAAIHPARAVALRFEPRSDGTGRLLPGGKVLHEVAFDLDGTPARMTDVLLPPNGTFHDLSFVAKGRHVVFRFQGDSDMVLKMAASLRGGRRS